jgi:hypothetical protein
VISGAFNDKSVHFVGVIIVWLSTCTEGQQLKLFHSGLLDYELYLAFI